MEIDELMETEDEVPSYEALNKMEYLEMAIMETVRMHPALSLIQVVVGRLIFHTYIR